MNRNTKTDYIKKPILLVLLSLMLGTLTNLDFVGAALRGEKKLTIEEKVEDAASVLVRITLAEASEAFMADSALFIDARDRDSFEMAHIPGAINVPWEEVQYDYSKISEWVPPGVNLITYCDGSDCESSLLLARALREKGYSDVVVFFGGWVEWEEAEYPIEEGFY